MKPNAGSMNSTMAIVLCWLVVIEMSVRVSFLPFYLGITPGDGNIFTGQDRSLLFLLNGLPILLFWYAARYFPYRAAILFVMLFVLDVFVYAFTGKVRMLLSPVVFSDISKIIEAVHVRSAAAEKMSAFDYLRFTNLLVPLLMWRHLGKKNLPFGYLKEKKHQKLETAGLAIFCAIAVYCIFVAVSLLSGNGVDGLLHLDYANANTAGQSSKISSLPNNRLVHNESKPVDPADPVLWDKKNIANFTADPIYFLKDFAMYGPLFSFILSAKEHFVIKEELRANSPAEEAVRNAANYLSSTRFEGHFKDVQRKSARPNVIVILEEAMGSASLDPPLLRGSGRKVTPFMDSLRGEQVFSDRVFSPVLGWQTPQSEFMVLCSALPAGVLDRYGIVYTNHMEHDYVSLPSILRQRGYHTAVFHPYYKNFWQRVKAYNRLGFESYYSADDFETGRTAGLGLCDEDFLRQVAGKMRGLPEPYFVFIITLSGHAPFNLPDDMKAGVTKGIAGIDPYASKYFDAMNYADRSLKSFWDQTKDIRQHSIFVVFGDHQGLVSVDQYRSVGYNTHADDTVLRHMVPLVISAPYMKGNVAPLKGVVADLADVAPTVLDMLDVPAPPCFIGNSLFGGKVAAMDGIGDIMDERRVCNYTRGTYYDYVAGKPLRMSDCKDLLRKAEAARIVSADVIWGKGYSYRGLPEAHH